MPRISSKNQLTVPVSALAEAGLGAGDQVVVEPVGDGELRVRRSTMSAEEAFGCLTGVYPPDYLERLDGEDAERDGRP